MTKKIYIDKEQVATKQDLDSQNTNLDAEIKKRPLTVNNQKPDENGNITVELPNTPDLAPYETKADAQTALDAKADKSDTYTKEEVDSAIAKDGSAKSVTLNGGEKIMPDETGNVALTIQQQDLTPYAKSDDVNTELAKKANTEDVTSLGTKVDANTSDISALKNKKAVYHFANETDGNAFLATDQATDAIVVVDTASTPAQ